MKLFDFFIYICLIAFGIAVGWFIRGEQKVEFVKPNPNYSKQVNVKSRPTPNTRDDGSFSPPPQVPNAPKIENEEITNKPATEIPNQVVNLATKNGKEDSQQLKIREVQKALSKNDFLGAIKLLASYKNNIGDEFAYNESLNLITSFVQTKVTKMEQQTVLADIEKALGTYPGWWPLIVLKGQVYAAIGEFEEGAQNLKKEMFYVINEKELNELLSFVRLLRSKRIEQLKQQKLFIRLMEYYEELILEDSAYPIYYFELGKLYAEKKDFVSALVMLRIIESDETYGKEAAAIIEQILIAQELEAARQIVKMENKSSLEIPIVAINDRIYIDVFINGKTSAKFLVDTGATISLISFPLAAKLGFTSAQMNDLRWFQTANGKVKKPVVKLATFAISEVKMQDFMVSVSKDVGSDFEGLLGMNFLGRFNFEINHERNLLILRQK